MQREIKFRGWFEDIGMQPITDIETSCTLMQYTGLKDKNGLEIYEGDVLSYADGVRRFVVEWQGNYPDFNYGWNFGNRSDFEVIGNVYEHPHLLDN